MYIVKCNQEIILVFKGSDLQSNSVAQRLVSPRPRSLHGYLPLCLINFNYPVPDASVKSRPLLPVQYLRSYLTLHREKKDVP